MNDRLVADREEITRFVRSIFPYADAGTHISYRVFDQNRRDVPPVLIYPIKVNGDASRLVDWGVRVAQMSADQPLPTVFAPPVCTFQGGKGAKGTDLANGLCLSVECDATPNAARTRLEGILGPVTLAVASGSEWDDPTTGEIQPKLHLHWRLNEPTREPEDHQRLREARALAALLVGADPTGAPPVHPFRWPGSWNTKAKPTLARIITENSDLEIDLSDALDRLQEAVEGAGFDGASRKPHSAGQLQAPIRVIRSAMEHLSNPGVAVHYSDWIRLGYACFNATGGAAEGFETWDAWSRKSDKYNAGETEAAWQRIGAAITGTNAPVRCGAGTIFYMAQQEGWTRPAPLGMESPPEPEGAPDGEGAGPKAADAPKKTKGKRQKTGDWRDELARNDEGKPLRTLSNVLVALRRCEAWKGVFAWNEFSCRLTVTRDMPGFHNPLLEVPRDLSEADISNATDWIQRRGIVVASSITLEAVRAVADEHRYHPVRDYLTSLVWDQTPRLETWLIDHVGAEDTPLNRAFGLKWPIGAVARVMRPGCKLDTALILESEKQGLKKSTVFAELADPWFTDHVPDLGSKDAMLQLQGVWIIELSELSSLSRSETNRTKAFLATKSDRFRPPFGKFAVDHKRQCAFGGTVNLGGTGYLRDETGARRYWCVECAIGWEPERQIDIPELAIVRDQIWGEALHRFNAGECWWLDTPALEALQADAAEERFEDDSRSSQISEFVRSRDTVQMIDLFSEECLNVPSERQTRALQTDVGRIMRALKWKRKRRRLTNKPQWYYLRTPATL